VKTGSFKGVLLFALMITSLIFYICLSVYGQEENVFTVSPGEFTVRDAPPIGTPYTIPQKLVVWNRDDVPRTVLITVEVPPEDATTPGYEPIPNKDWIRLYPPSIVIEGNSFAEVQIALNIPRWENLTRQRWEVWIPVERQPLPGEAYTFRPTVRMKIETTEERPPAPGLSELPSIENVNVEITIEARSDGNCHIEVSAEGPPIEGIEEGLEELPVTQGSLNIKVESPTPGQLDIMVDVSATFRQPVDPEISTQITEMVAAYAMMPDMVNSMLLQQAQSALENTKEDMPPELQDLEVSDLRVTKLTWSESRLEAGLSATLSSNVYENKELRAKLPVNIDATLSVSATRLTLTIELEGQKAEGSLEIVLATDETTLDLDATFELPRVEGRVHWGLEVPEAEMIPGLEDMLGEFLEKNNFALTLKVPTDATVSGLPSDYSQVGNTYTWSGDNAADALDLVLTGGVQGNVTYGYKPPAEFPWLVVGALVVVVVVVVVVAAALRKR